MLVSPHLSVVGNLHVGTTPLSATTEVPANVKWTLGQYTSFQLVVMLMVGCWSLSTDAQEVNRGDAAAESSILETREVGANGTASVSQSGSNPADSETIPSAQLEMPMPPAPSVPRGVIMAKSSPPGSFTETSSPSGTQSESPNGSGDGGQATGTFAFDDPFVKPSNQPPSNQPPSNQPSMLPALPQQGLTNPAPGNRLPALTQNELRESPNGMSMGDSNRSTSTKQLPTQSSNYDAGSQPTTPESFRAPSIPVQPLSNTTNFSNQSIPNSSSRLVIPPSTANAGAPDRGYDDNRVRPTGFNQSMNVRQSTNTDLAMRLMDRYRVSAAPDPLPGQPTSMLEMLQQPITPGQRGAMVQQYWETYYDWATLLSRVKHVRWLNSIATPSSKVDLALLNAARSAARNQMLAAEIQLGKSQSLLTDFMPGRRSDIKPLPSDQPIVQNYNTNYDLYKSRGLIPTRIRGIDSILPKKLQLISDRAQTVELAQTAAQNASDALRNRQTTFATVMEAAKLWRAAEQDLIASVIAYNQAIGDYSLTTFGRFNPPPTQLVDMLIAKPKPAKSQIANRDSGNSQLSPGRYGQPRNSFGNPTRSDRLSSQNGRSGNSINASRTGPNGFGRPSQFGNSASNLPSNSSPGSLPPLNGPTSRTANSGFEGQFPKNGDNNSGRGGSGFQQPPTNPRSTGSQPNTGGSNGFGGNSFGGNGFGGN